MINLTVKNVIFYNCHYIGATLKLLEKLKKKNDFV